jgi:hypothetical protein
MAFSVKKWQFSMVIFQKMGILPAAQALFYTKACHLKQSITMALWLRPTVKQPQVNIIGNVPMRL